MSDTDTKTSFDFIKWCRGNSLAVVLLVTITGTLVFFFGALRLFVNGAESAAQWAWLAWNPEQDQEHSVLVPFIFLGLIWYHWDEMVKARKKGVTAGLYYIGAGILFFLASTRCLEPRMALVSIPFILYGATLYVWGKAVARLMLFPCAFLIFLVPFGVIQQFTFRLQFIITGIVTVLANLIGISTEAGGTTLIAKDSSFYFEVAEGCSGIHSIISITMLTTIFMHLTQSQLWKKVVVVISSVAFAIIGNIGRILTILIVAKVFNKDIASGKYHTISGYIIYPFAILAMLGFSTLLDRYNPEPGAPGSDGGDRAGGDAPVKKPPQGPTYDYDY